MIKPEQREVLMHLVLDGEATPEQSRELERLLAADPAAQAQFDDLRALFDGLARVPQGYPPEGLVAAVMADLPRFPRVPADTDQLFPPPDVIAASSKESRTSDPGELQPVPTNFQTGPSSRSANMSEQQRGSFSKRKIWIGVAAAIAGVVVASQFIDFPATGENAAGTIAPAARFRADQPTAADVKLGGQGSSPTVPGGTVPNAGSLAGGGNAQGGGSLSGGGQSQGGGTLSGGGQSQGGGTLSGGGQSQGGGTLSGGGNAQGGGALSGGGNAQGGNLGARSDKK